MAAVTDVDCLMLLVAIHSGGFQGHIHALFRLDLFSLVPEGNINGFDLRNRSADSILDCTHDRVGADRLHLHLGALRECAFVGSHGDAHAVCTALECLCRHLDGHFGHASGSCLGGKLGGSCICGISGCRGRCSCGCAVGSFSCVGFCSLFSGFSFGSVFLFFLLVILTGICRGLFLLVGRVLRGLVLLVGIVLAVAAVVSCGLVGLFLLLFLLVLRAALFGGVLFFGGSFFAGAVFFGGIFF